jgi:hypothetical protein
MLAVKGKGHVPQQGAAVDAGDQRRAVQGIEDLAADGQELAQGRGIGLAPGGILLRPLGVFLHQQVHQGRSQAKAAPYLHTAAHVHDGDRGDHVGQAAAAGQVDAVAGFGGQGAVSWSSRDMGSPRLSQNWEKSPLMWSRTARAVSAGSKMARPAWTGSKRGSGFRFTTA